MNNTEILKQEEKKEWIEPALKEIELTHGTYFDSIEDSLYKTS